MSYREDGFIGPDYIARCHTCGSRDVDLYSRVRWSSDHEEILYVFVSCAEIYCTPGPCSKDPGEAIDGWNDEARED